MASSDSFADVAIVGAGPAGTAVALKLAKRGIDVKLIERSDYTQRRVGESLAPSVAPLLRKLEVWDSFQQLQPLPSYGIRSNWGGNGLRTHSHLQSAFGQGWHIDRCRADAMLADQAQQAGARMSCHTTVERLDYTKHKGWTLKLRTPTELKQVRVPVLVDATGRKASIARRLGAQQILFDRLVAVCAPYELSALHHEHHILLETCPVGWWYSAPLNSTQMMVMLMTDSDLCGADKYATLTRWHKLLRASPASAQRLRSLNARRIEPPWVVPAFSQRLNRLADVRPWLAAGDAALSVDPISGSGVVRALSSADRTVICIEELLSDQGKGSIDNYEAQWDQDCTAYLFERLSYYEIEQRWRGNPFWDRRTSEKNVGS
jgi:flavin-dependent dehydrogenase